MLAFCSHHTTVCVYVVMNATRLLVCYVTFASDKKCGWGLANIENIASYILASRK